MDKDLGTDDLYRMACDAEDADREVNVYRSEIDDEIILWIEIDGEEFHNDLYEEELDDSDMREIRRHYYE